METSLAAIKIETNFFIISKYSSANGSDHVGYCIGIFRISMVSICRHFGDNFRKDHWQFHHTNLHDSHRLLSFIY